MVIEGLLEFEGVRDYLYSKMRGVHGVDGGEQALPPGSTDHLPPRAASQGAPVQPANDLGASLAQIRDELRAGREALERMAEGRGGE